MHQRRRDRLFAIIILTLFAFAFVADLAMPNPDNVVRADGEIIIIGGFIAVALGGIIHLICPKNDPDARKKISDFFERNKDR